MSCFHEKPALIGAGFSCPGEQAPTSLQLSKGSDYFTGGTVEGERRGSAVRPGPGAIETRLRTEAASRRDRSVIRNIGDGNGATTLRITAVPELRNCLAIGKRELQTPATDCRATSICNGERSAKTSLPLTGDRVMYATTQARCTRWCGSRRGAFRWCGSRRSPFRWCGSGRSPFRWCGSRRGPLRWCGSRR
jgi:hypothetical protein